MVVRKEGGRREKSSYFLVLQFESERCQVNLQVISLDTKSKVAARLDQPQCSANAKAPPRLPG